MLAPMTAHHVRRAIGACALAFVHAAGVSSAQAADPVAIPLSAERGTLGPDARLVEHHGVPAIELGKTLMRAEAALNGLVFADGTIELDVEPTGSMGPAIAFRRRD